jgi:hypothetical protein
MLRELRGGEINNGSYELPFLTYNDEIDKFGRKNATCRKCRISGRKE